MSLTTLNEMLAFCTDRFKDRPAFKVKKDGQFIAISYQELYQRIKQFGTGLLELDCKPGDHIGLISENRLEWIISDLAIIGIGAVDVPASGNSYAQDIAFKLKHSDSTVSLLEGEKVLAEFLKVYSRLPAIKQIILMEPVKVFAEEQETPEWAEAVSFQTDGRISKDFYQAIYTILTNHHSGFLIISQQAQDFLEKYLQEYGSELLQKTGTKNQAEGRKKIWDRIYLIREGQIGKLPPIYSFQRISDNGKKLLEKGDSRYALLSQKARPDDLITIIYTSGTTSDPKGVMLTHRNIMHNVINLPKAVGNLVETDRFLSVLPSWHIYERTVEYCALSVGASTAYSKPFKQILLPDLQSEKPTLLCTVPRIWTSLYKGIQDKMKKGSAIQRWLFNKALDIAKEYKPANRILEGTMPLFDRESHSSQEIEQARKTVNRLSWQYRIADRVIFKKIREMLGGQIKFAISGGGALPQVIDTFLDAANIYVLEGYGLTETSPVIAGRTYSNPIIFTVGAVIPETFVKIVDKDNLTSELPNGQSGVVMVKGDLVMKGYYKNERKTAEVLQDGWFNTGDLGKKTHNGKYLKIIGRIKDTIVLRGGENIEPQPLEDKLKESPYINMVMLAGQDKPRLGALIVPDFEVLKEYAQHHHILYQDKQDLLEKKEILSLFQKEQKRLISRENGFQLYETVMGITLLPEEFTQEKGEMTESLKLKRFVIHEKYQQEIDQICGE